MNILYLSDLVLGITFAVFYKERGRFAAYFQERYMGYKYVK